jgi:hypothetical protein
MRRQRQRRHRRRLRESPAARGEGVERGRFGAGMAVAAEPVGAQRVNGNEQEVGPAVQSGQPAAIRGHPEPHRDERHDDEKCVASHGDP